MDENFNIENHKIKQEELFDVPQGYFEKLESDILAKTVGAKEESKVIRFNYKKWIPAVAASFILVTATWYMASKDMTTDGEMTELAAEINNEDIFSYLYDNYTEEELQELSSNMDIQLDNEDVTIDIEMTEEDILNAIEEIDLEDYEINK